MAAYNFKKQFVEPIRAGTKSHTIRADRKDGRIPKVGEMLALYCGMRTKGCFRILPEPVICTKVQPIDIQADSETILLQGDILEADEREQLAKADGFVDFAAMMRFWEGRLPFTGYIIHWRQP